MSQDKLATTNFVLAGQEKVEKKKTFHLRTAGMPKFFLMFIITRLFIFFK